MWRGKRDGGASCGVGNGSVMVMVVALVVVLLVVLVVLLSEW